MGYTNSRFPSSSILADFEAVLQGSEEETNPNPISSYTREVNHHVLFRFCTYTTFVYGEIQDPLRLYREKDCVEAFAITLRRKLRDSTICSLKS